MALVTGEEVGQEGFRPAIQWLAVFSNVDDGILGSPQLDRLQEALDVRIGLFDGVGLRTNTNKTMGVVYQSLKMTDRHPKVAYMRWMTVVGHRPLVGCV